MTLAEIKTYTTTKLAMTDSATLTIAELFAKARWRMIWNEADWKQTRYQETIAVSAGTQDVNLNTRFDAVKACRWAGQNEILAFNDASALALDAPGYDAAGTPLAFVPLGKTSGGILQLRLLRIPTVAGNLLVIGKRKPVELTTGSPDTDNVAEVPIPGASEVLCEMVMGDLYEWLRQFSKAGYYFGKGGILLEKMKEIETSQAAEIRRIVPMVQMLDGEGTGFDSLRPLG